MTTDLKSQVIQKLKGLEGNITGLDKTQACEKLKISRPTLDKYLSGDVSNVDTGISIFEFFNGKITRRIQRLNKVA